MMATAQPLAALLAVFAIAGTGCGGDTGDTDRSGSNAFETASSNDAARPGDESADKPTADGARDASGVADRAGAGGVDKRDGNARGQHAPSETRDGTDREGDRDKKSVARGDQDVARGDFAGDRDGGSVRGDERGRKSNGRDRARESSGGDRGSGTNRGGRGPSAADNSSGGSSSPNHRDDGGGVGDSTDEPRGDEPETHNQVVLGAEFLCVPMCPGIDITFGAVGLGEQRTMTLTVASKDQTTITAVSINGDNADDFRLRLGSCNVGRKLGGDMSCTLRVTFRPSAQGIRTATLNIDAERGGSATGAEQAVGLALSLKGGGGDSSSSGQGHE